MEGARPRVLLVGSGHPVFRQYTLRQAIESADLWLLDPAPASPTATNPPPALRAGRSSISLLTPPESCILESVDFDAEGAHETGSEGVHFEATAQPGEELLFPPDGYACRYAVLIADGTGPTDCAQKLEAAVKFVRLEYRALA
jgi:hypothetical protein